MARALRFQDYQEILARKLAEIAGNTTEIKEIVLQEGRAFDVYTHGNIDSMEHMELTVMVEMALQDGGFGNVFLPDDFEDARTAENSYQVVCRTLGIEPDYSDTAAAA